MTYYGKTAFAATMVEVPVQQPPKKAAPTSMKGIRKEANKQLKAHKAHMKEGRGRIKALNKQIRGYAFGKRLAGQQKSQARQDVRDIRKQMKAANAHHRGFMQMQGSRLKHIKSEARKFREQARAAKKALKASKPRAQRKARTREHSAKAKSFNWKWVMAKLKRLLKAKGGKMDGRNHGFKGSGKGGRTGRAGFHR